MAAIAGSLFILLGLGGGSSRAAGGGTAFRLSVRSRGAGVNEIKAMEKALAQDVLARL